MAPPVLSAIDVDAQPGTAKYLNGITAAIIAAAIEVHRVLGPGLLEMAYARCLAVELRRAGYDVHRNRAIRLEYKGEKVGPAYFADLLVESCVIVEVKAVEKLHPICERQLFTYLRIMDCRVGLVLNFGGDTLKAGIRRVVYNFPDEKRPAQAR